MFVRRDLKWVHCGKMVAWCQLGDMVIRDKMDLCYTDFVCHCSSLITKLWS